MKIEKLSREQLIELKSNIDLRISHLEREEHNKKLNSIKSFEKLSDMKKGGDIFCVNFSGEKYTIWISFVSIFLETMDRGIQDLGPHMKPSRWDVLLGSMMMIYPVIVF